MITGIASFKEWFKDSEEQYAIIGGTACDILMTEEGLDFRATKEKILEELKAKQTRILIGRMGGMLHAVTDYQKRYYKNEC